MKAMFFAMLAAASLSACGGGGTDNVIIPDYSAGIKNAMPAVAASIPKIDPPSYNPALNVVPSGSVTQDYVGGNVIIFGKDAGYVIGSSPRSIAESIAKIVVSDPVQYSVPYKEMLSDAGFKITVEASKDTWSVFFVRLTSAGVVVTSA